MNNNQLYILAVDDQVDNLVALEAALGGQNYEIITATSGAESLLKLFERDYAVILMDIRMPFLDGVETAELIRLRGIDTPILFLTELQNIDAYALRALAAGAIDFLSKPVNVEILRAKIAFFVELFRKNQELAKQAAQLSASADRKYRDLVEGIRNGFVWMGIVGYDRFTFVSAAAEEITRYPTTRWLSEKHFLLTQTHPEDRETVATSFTALLTTGEDADFEHRVIREDGSVLWLRSTVRLTRVGSHREYRGLSVDITMLKETERSLREAILARDEFLFVASHELKTPLTPLKLQIEGFQRLLRRGDLRNVTDETLSRMLETSAAQVTSLGRLVDQLLDVSRIKAGRVPLVRERMDLVALVNKVLTTFHNTLATKNITISSTLPSKLEGSWDENRLEQVLINLLDNAIKYGLGKPIEIRLGQEAGQARLEVRDRGIGIDSNSFERIFKRFERAVSPTNYSGLGLGLYICHQIIQSHQGSIAVTSQPRDGSAFTLLLPI